MTDEELSDFLNMRFVGALSTLRNDGAPNVIPIWYRWTGAEIKLWTDPEFGWVKRLQTDPRVAFAVFEHDAPRRAAYFRGTASVVEGAMADLLAEIRAISARYIDAADLDEQVASYDRGGNKAIVTITPSFVKGAVN
jgi:nitroimidazol reductase NimA-like FMN-containing flavoprotein (pyridoxamine 5'-phosphate oxidase superfamily)